MTFAEVLPAFIDGQSIARKAWKTTTSAKLGVMTIGEETYKTVIFKGLAVYVDRREHGFDIDDVLAKDWRVLDGE